MAAVVVTAVLGVASLVSQQSAASKAKRARGKALRAQEEARDIANALSIFDTALKSVSFLPLNNSNYDQMPYQEITEKQYNEMASKLSKPDYSSFLEDAVGEKFCDSDKCTI